MRKRTQEIPVGNMYQLLIHINDTIEKLDKNQWEPKKEVLRLLGVIDNLKKYVEDVHKGK